MQYMKLDYSKTVVIMSSNKNCLSIYLRSIVKPKYIRTIDTHCEKLKSTGINLYHNKVYRCQYVLYETQTYLLDHMYNIVSSYK